MGDFTQLIKTLPLSPKQTFHKPITQIRYTSC